MIPGYFLELFLGVCFSFGIKFNIKGKEASVCINLKMYANHLFIARLQIHALYIPIYAGEYTKYGGKIKENNFLFYIQFYEFYISQSL